MDWRLFSSTFLMIFLAELGDKTQLAVMSQSATSASRWTVFWAGAMALTASTAIGVLCGSVLRRWVPDDRYIKVSAGILFLVFGCLMLREGFKPRVAPVAETAPLAPVQVGALGRFVLAQAARFEQAAFEDYRKLAASAENPAVRALFLELAAEEESHFATIGQMRAEQAEKEGPAGVDAAAVSVADALTHDVASAADRPVLEHAIEHELATAGFYREMARTALVPGLKTAFGRLAAAEERHAERMRQLLSGKA